MLACHFLAAVAFRQQGIPNSLPLKKWAILGVIGGAAAFDACYAAPLDSEGPGMHAYLLRTRISKSWLFKPPLRGAWTLGLVIAAIAIPTMIRLAMSHGVDDEACTIFSPFVLAVSILCGGRYALAVALGSALACNTILMGTPYSFHVERSEIEGLSTFLGYSLFVILIVHLFRLTAARSLRQAGAGQRESGVVFSLDRGQAWASWYGIDAPVRLGAAEEVVPMMEDFIAQVNVAKRLRDRTRTECAASDS